MEAAKSENKAPERKGLDKKEPNPGPNKKLRR